jgi:hypothetical protein
VSGRALLESLLGANAVKDRIKSILENPYASCRSTTMTMPRVIPISRASGLPRLMPTLSEISNSSEIAASLTLRRYWGTKGSSNPLLEGKGVPSSAFVETVFAMAGFELTPGLSSASSCPEAMWQSAKWWTDFYEKTATGSSSSAKSGKGKSSKGSPGAVPRCPKAFTKSAKSAPPSWNNELFAFLLRAYQERRPGVRR